MFTLLMSLNGQKLWNFFIKVFELKIIWMNLYVYLLILKKCILVQIVMCFDWENIKKKLEKWSMFSYLYKQYSRLNILVFIPEIEFECFSKFWKLFFPHFCISISFLQTTANHFCHPTFWIHPSSMNLLCPGISILSILSVIIIIPVLPLTCPNISIWVMIFCWTPSWSILLFPKISPFPALQLFFSFQPDPQNSPVLHHVSDKKTEVII